MINLRNGTDVNFIFYVWFFIGLLLLIMEWRTALSPDGAIKNKSKKIAK